MRLILACVTVLLASCISTNGAFEPYTQFVYPNSNVRTLAPTEASAKKFGILAFVPSFDGNRK